MTGKQPVFTENFSANLSSIKAFLGAKGRPAYRRFSDRLFEETIPAICRFPQSGHSFLERSIRSTKAQALTNDLRRLLQKTDDLREYLIGDHLVLYLVRRDRIVFLSVKHHRQLSFDLKQFWQRE